MTHISSTVVHWDNPTARTYHEADSKGIQVTCETGQWEDAQGRTEGGTYAEAREQVKAFIAKHPATILETITLYRPAADSFDNAGRDISDLWTSSDGNTPQTYQEWRDYFADDFDGIIGELVSWVGDETSDTVEVTVRVSAEA